VSLRGKKLGILLSGRPETPGFNHGLRLAERALAEGLGVYLYCIDDALSGVSEPRLQRLKRAGLRLYACAYGAQRRGLPVSDAATFGGLAALSELMRCADRFVSFG
jgi:sulfur relay (sulfurtransferase) complex TusBCD TusD component (DsrE family)